MINGVGSASQALQGLQANRSFQAAGRSGSVFRQALLQEIQDTEQVQTSPELPQENPAYRTSPLSQSQGPIQPIEPNRVVSQQPASNTLQPLIHDVLQVAQTAGFVDVNPQDVIRAYQTGQSLLADYKV